MFEIVLKYCDKIIDVDGNIVLFNEVKVKEIKGIIYIFFDEVLWMFCLVFREVDICFGWDDFILNKGLILMVIMGIKDFVCFGVWEVVKLCFVVGIKVIVIRVLFLVLLVLFIYLIMSEFDGCFFIWCIENIVEMILRIKVLIERYLDENVIFFYLYEGVNGDW